MNKVEEHCTTKGTGDTSKLFKQGARVLGTLKKVLVGGVTLPKC